MICDWSSAMQSVPAGTFVEVGVARDPIVGNCMHLFRYLGSVSTPVSGIPFLTPFTRQSIAGLSSAQITALRAGIQVMMSKPVTDPTSYRFQANIHGTLDTPTTMEEMQSWNQCEHGSFYFPSWHRMYLYFFDRILRAAAGSAGYQNVVLPYWNYNDPAQRTCPRRSGCPPPRAIRFTSRRPGDPQESIAGPSASRRAQSTIPARSPMSISTPGALWATASAQGRPRRRNSTRRPATSRCSPTMSFIRISAG